MHARIDQHCIYGRQDSARGTNALPCPRRSPGARRNRRRRRPRGLAAISCSPASSTRRSSPPRSKPAGPPPHRSTRRRALRRQAGPWSVLPGTVRLGASRPRHERPPGLNHQVVGRPGSSPACELAVDDKLRVIGGCEAQPVAHVREGHEAGDRVIAVPLNPAHVQEEVDLGGRESRQHGWIEIRDVRRRTRPARVFRAAGRP